MTAATLFAGNGSRFRYLVDYLPPPGVVEVLTGATIEASLIAEDGAEIIADVAQVDAADGADWAANRLALVLPAGDPGTDAQAVVDRIGQTASLQITITRSGAAETFAVPVAITIARGY